MTNLHSPKTDDISSLHKSIDRIVRAFKIDESIALNSIQKKLPPPDSHALIYVYNFEGCIIGDISRHLSVGATTTSAIVNRLTKMNLVERRRTEENRRIVQLYLTELGKKIAHEIIEEQYKHCEMLLQALPEDEQKMFVNLLTKVAKNLS